MHCTCISFFSVDVFFSLAVEIATCLQLLQKTNCKEFRIMDGLGFHKPKPNRLSVFCTDIVSLKALLHKRLSIVIAVRVFSCLW